MKLSIVIPVYNEIKTLGPLLHKVASVNISGVTKEIILVDDCSIDGSREFLKKTSYKTYFHSVNKGKGAALRTGFSHATGDFVLVQDADLEYDPRHYPLLLAPLLKKQADVVYGSRFITHQDATIFSHYLGNKFLTYATNLLYCTHLTDMETGYKVFRKEVLTQLHLRGNRFDIEPEITAKLLKKHFKIVEVPIEHIPRKWDAGKKITWVDGVYALYYLCKYRFTD